MSLTRVIRFASTLGSARLPVRYGLALATAAVFLFASHASESTLTGIVFTVPIALGALLTLALGAGPGVLFAVVTGLGLWFVFQQPDDWFVYSLRRELVRVTGFFATSLTVIVTIELLHRTRRRLERASEELAAERDFTSSILETAGSLVLVLDREGRVVRFNRACEATSGYAAHEVMGQSYERFVPPEERPALRETFERLTLNGSPQPHENHWVAKDGTRRRIAWSNAVIVDDSGHVRFFVATGIDVTERRRAEEALRVGEEELRASEAKFRAVFEQAAIGIGRVSFKDARWMDANDAFCHMLGYDRETMLRTPWPEMTHPEDIDLDLSAFRRMATGELERYTVEKRFFHARGQLVWARLTLSLVRDARGRPDYEIAVIEDITERRRAEEALRASEATVNAILDALPVGVAIADARGRIVRDNAALRELWGAPPETGSWEEYGAWVGFWPDTGERIRAEEWAMTRALLHGQETRNELVQYQRFGSSGRRYALNNVVPLHDDDGRITGGVAAMIDVTEQRAADEALRRANDQLVEMDRRKNEFLAVLSHELRNPLAPIRSSLFVLDHASPGGEQAKRARQVIDRQAQHMTRLVEDLLDVTRISRGKITLQRERVDLDAVARGTAEDHREWFAANGIELDVNGAEVPLWVDGDRTRLAQMIGNLLHNAGKFTPRGGRAVLSVEASGPGEAVIRVRDDGAGMSAETLEHLFEPFEQGAQSIERARGGLGLGLALVKGLVELHGGRVAARSDGEGKGSEFALTLPLRAPDRAEHAPVAGPQRSGRPRRVLVIEDNVDAAETLRDALELEAHEVALAYSGTEGVDKARQYRPDVILCDIGLPDMDGYGVAQALRRDPDPELSTTYLVALSGYALEEDVTKARRAGFDRHMAKPPRMEQLEALLLDARDRPTASAP